MLTEEEAGTAYTELLQKLRAIGARAVADEIEAAVGQGRVREQERLTTQERLPAAAALEIALRMLAAWIEPAFLVAEAKHLLGEASATPAAEIRWTHDRVDIVGAIDETAGMLGSGALPDVPSLNATEQDAIREATERLQQLATEIEGAESEEPWRR